MNPPFQNLSLSRQKFFSGIIVLCVIVAGSAFQYSYHYRKVIYTREITGFYQKYFQREPDAKGLKHWVTWALNKWSLKKVERKAFIEVAETKRPT